MALVSFTDRMPASRRLGLLMLAAALAGCGTLPGTHATPRLAGKSAAQHLFADSNTMAGFMDNAFDRADADRDGYLSGQELRLSPEQFRALDRDGDGQISRDEWTWSLPQDQALKALVPFQPMVDETFKRIDTNHDGVISMDEARACVAADNMRVHGPEPLKLATVMMAASNADRDGNGVITPAEFPTFYTLISQDGAGMTTSRGWFGGIAQVLLGGYLAVTSRIGEHIAMHPSRKKNDQGTPAKWGYAFDEVTFHTSDGLTIRGWYIPAATPTDETVIEVHGINDCRDTFVREGQIAMLHDKYNQLAFDLRNQGQSDGNITSYGLYEARDVLAAKAWLQAHGTNHVVTYGISLGAASVINAAAQDRSIEGVIDDCAFSTDRSAFAGFADITFIPAPELIAAAILVRANAELGADMTTAQPISVIHNIAPRPLLIIHGAQDPNIPPEDSSLNYQAAGDGFHKELWFAPGGGHATSAVAQPDAYKQHLRDFLDVAFHHAASMPAPRI